MAHLTDGEATVWRGIFDAWRQHYDEWPYASHQYLYSLIWDTFPHQEKYNFQEVADTIKDCNAHRVWELGGWTGKLAHDVMRFGIYIEYWRNTEICREAVSNGFSNQKYWTHCPTTWVWNCARSDLKFDIAILSHVIEHMSFAHLEKLIDYISDIPYLYIQTPTSMGTTPHPTGWMRTMSTHKLEVGWNAVNKLLSDKGYILKWQHDESRLFVR